MSNFSLEDLLRQVMQGADDTYRQQAAFDGLGFVIGKSLVTSDDGKQTCGLIPAMSKITTLPKLRRFAASVRKAVRVAEAQTAGILCELPLSLDGEIPEATVVLYVDQKYSGMKVYIAKKTGEHLKFRDLGVAHPGMNFLPSLIPIESYGPIVAEA